MSLKNGDQSWKNLPEPGDPQLDALNQSILKPWNITELELSLQFGDLHTNDDSDDDNNSIDLTSNEDNDSDDNDDLQSLTSDQSEHPDDNSEPPALA
ncbi:hypothetical protein FQN55_001523 [Onygenales sp. PD_40]|nr:hypothetical protein FQN55_001523 [Onygenales sp. PD_40]